jgi:transcriptional antiterminator RfaH
MQEMATAISFLRSWMLINKNALATTQCSWVVLTTRSHSESLACDNLRRQGYNLYCPMIVKRIRHARKCYDAPRPLFPGYIFVEYRGEARHWRPILSTYGVRSLIRNGEVPARLPLGFVESLKAREIDGVIRAAETPLQPGQAVTIQGGPFDGLVGRILEIRDCDRILLLLDLLNQQTKVSVDAKRLGLQAAL